MDLPVEEWQSHVRRRWLQLQPSVRAAFSTGALQEVILLCSSLLQPEDEAFLQRLAEGYSVEKDPNAYLFYKEEGNKAFQKKAYKAAAMLYSQGTSHARPNTQEMSLCFANRSAAFFYQAQYEICLEDIGRAQMHGYPERLQPKLMLRKAKCLVALGRRQEAALAIRDLEQNVAAREAGTGTPHLQDLQRRLRHLKTRGQEDKGPAEAHPTGPAPASKEVHLKAENERIPGAASSVSLCSDPSRGRHLIATEDILPGELLVKEEAFVSVLNPGETLWQRLGPEAGRDSGAAPGDLRCHRCLKPTMATVPCQGCSYAKYCSRQCMQLAWERYHRTECSLGGTLLTLGVFCHVALRTVLLAGFELVDKLVKTLQGAVNSEAVSVPEGQPPMEKLDAQLGLGKGDQNRGLSGMPIPGCDRDGSYQSSYHAVFHLLPHTERHSPERKFLCGLSVVALCKKLGEAYWPSPLWGQGPSKQEAALTMEQSPRPSTWAVAMLRHVLQLHCNAQGVTALQEAESEGDLVTERRQARLATGFFPVISLLNHSCSPNTSLAFRGSVGTVQASRLIAQGQEILHCYGPHECRMDVATRQQKLRSQYFFDCCCQACRDEEVRRASTTPKRGGFRCPTCKAALQGDDALCCSRGSCTAVASRPHLVGRLQDLQQRVEVALELLRGDKTARAVQLLLGCREEAENFLTSEHMLMGEIEDHLAQAYASLGDWPKSAAHLRNSLQVVEAQHGPASVEIGHELFKLAQVLFNGLEATLKRAPPSFLERQTTPSPGSLYEYPAWKESQGSTAVSDPEYPE
ncbi:protein-lysine N-methyltransferase SMYD4 isoform X2 [Phascolarctos cinereus]|uniref:Protein-lysine N-methyltransferase SMYD4 n=1 Tax=Phascolarctos cinereus TaxID=38626 RepID=A0A6P5M340_PHACI|nr:SET and MYND domain-containing protein 4 isoform X2 [Phascolarctos cinereus]